MRKIDEDQPRFQAVCLAHNRFWILDAKDAAALQDIIARNPVYEPEPDNKYDRSKRTFIVAEGEEIETQTVRRDQVKFPTPSLADAVQMALRK